MNIALIFALMLGCGDFQKQLDLAGDNRLEIEQAIHDVPKDQFRGMEWLLVHMPPKDLKVLTAEFLLTNCDLAYEAWENAPWKDQITEDIFFDTILPYASVNERRDDWRGDFRNKFSSIVKDAKSPTEATILLNKNIFDMVDVHYSTERPKADQSPYESIDAGMASCTGLSILLIDACRSVGVPARFTGTPLWYNNTGNHNWVEFWDDGWHYTGGAEPTGDRVDESWFDDSASKATKGHPRHAIFAVSWNKTEQHFPLVWLPEVKTYGAIDVTDRYTMAVEESPHLIPIRFRVRDGEGNRQATKITLQEVGTANIWEMQSNDDGDDANYHATMMMPQGMIVLARTKSDAVKFAVDIETIIDLTIGELTKEGANAFASQFWNERAKQWKIERAPEMESKVFTRDGMSMPFWYTTFGDAPFGEKSLWISMHGGGGAPPEANTSQWENQKKLYTLDEGVYLVPRAPTDTWNLWHQSHIDPMFERLIENMIVFEGVNPNKVYIIGYSAGGDGVFQLAPRMADRLAAAGMMAGHPNETVPDGLRNIGFALHMGENDSAYDRNSVAMQWKQQLEILQRDDPSGYAHQAVIHEGKGHWMDRQETMAFPWMAEFTRNPNPQKIVWVQDDVVHDQFYWLGVDEPVERTKIVASIDGQTITIHETDVQQITFYLNDNMLDLEFPVVVVYEERTLGTFEVIRNSATIIDTLRDPTDYYTATLNIGLP